MDQRISLVTLGCRDIAGSAAFYEKMGWRREQSPDGIVVFDLVGQSLALYPLEDLARDMGCAPESLGAGAMTLAHNVDSREAVDALAERADAAGGRVLKAPHEVFWGGYIAYVADPEGHVWEFAHNPLSPLRAGDGAFRWEGY